MINRKTSVSAHHDMTDEEWASIRTFLPMDVQKDILSREKKRDSKSQKNRKSQDSSYARRGRPSGDVRKIMNGILYVMRTGTAWRNMPKNYGYWNTAYKSFIRWKEEYVFDKVCAYLGMEEIIDNVYAYD